MTQHRYPCMAEPPELIQPSGPIAAAFGNHRHACKHDATTEYHWLAEHECSCGMTWRALARPAPDLSWITYEPDPKWRDLLAILPIFAAAMIPLLMVGALVIWLVLR